MTTEEKAKAYDEALERVKELKSKWIDEDGKTVAEMIFPELAESEDERIRKELMEMVDRANFDDYEKKKKFISWLEKQKEQKIDANDICVKKMVDIYRCTDEYDEEGNHKGTPVNCMVRAYEQGIRDILKIVKQKPAEWSDEDDYRIRWIISLLTTMQEKCIDDRYGDSVPDDIPDMISWLKSLRPQPKAEWTETDKNLMDAAIAFVEQNNHFNCWAGTTKKSVLAFLRSLRPQSHWKPDEDQMRALYRLVIMYLRPEDHYGLSTLYKDLVKLGGKDMSLVDNNI